MFLIPVITRHKVFMNIRKSVQKCAFDHILMLKNLQKIKEKTKKACVLKSRNVLRITKKFTFFEYIL